ncbi:preprotein translocase subunit SecY [Campylobacter sp. RM10532]|uniref:Preprotein translocase subunit SecY n=1 Tax=Campylobacter molothri TaxID=1032242 RepID=A0ACC5W3P6_9BACT|nr:MULTISPECIES: preprotein translocase subunit SecY [unclassified Campylobacter]MBZ7928935.1 preprotein translocase subunit SecY [Campylobacter sp. RM10542]MBZ7930336.1 preprotein translocase subunit SecY [Campylobacter sp. W0067]MBZ7933426.1 preprotein translocase subunit SecY [Campylobacter sp. RM10543]MBZ7938041.1 preprotein translocase subunit SecY [Campylobacter sp. RM10538]MBZ7941250.1 preprotein translocase subunit SecY [Campylobacter sp. W0047]MBZ7944145.1 preprotein translocase subu
MNRALTNKILITLAFLFAYRVLAYIPVPGVNADVIADFFNHNQNNALGLFNVFSGGAAQRFSIISLGIMPYITASIIMELFAATFPSIGKMKKERDSMQKYMQIIRYATILITLAQSIGVAIGLQSLHGKGGSSAIMMENLNMFIALCAISMLAGTMLLMWLGEQITQRGIGNGISLIIFAGIVSGIPRAISGTIGQVNSGEMNFLTAFAIFVLILITIGAIIYVELGERRIPISYSRKVVMQNQNKRIMNYIPIKINLSGVIPPIFASAILMFPTTILQTSTNPYIQAVNDFLNPNGYIFHILTFIFVIFFAYFYASIAFNAKDIADNLKKQGGFIPGIRPGEGTSNYLNEIASRLTLSGSIYLGIIATLPWVLVKFMGVPFQFGGTSVLIVVQVALDTMRKIEAQIYMNKYQTLSAVGL